PKPIVKITGEFYLQTVEGAPNYNLHQWLETEGAWVCPQAVAVCMAYLLRHGNQKFDDSASLERSARIKLGAGRVVQKLYRGLVARLRHALGDLPHEMPQQLELRRLAAPYFHSRLDGGEGDMLVGKALWAHLGKKAHMICELSPYSCMPNTMSIGAMAGVVGKYPDLLYAPLEIKGDAEVDVGSTTVKAVLVEDSKTLWQDYQRHNTRQGEKVLEFLGRMETEARFAPGDRVFFTGSGAGGLAPLVGGKLVQEVVAVAACV